LVCGFFLSPSPFSLPSSLDPCLWAVRRALWLLQLRHSPPVPAAYFVLPEETLRGHKALLWGLLWELSQACPAPAPAPAPQAAAAPGRGHAHASEGAAGAVAVAALDDPSVLYRPPLAVAQGLPPAHPAPSLRPETDTAMPEEGAVAVPVPPSLAAAVRRWYADDIQPRGEMGGGTVAVATDADAADADDGGNGKGGSGGYAAFTASLAAAGADVPCEGAAPSLSPQPTPASAIVGTGTGDDGEGEGEGGCDSLPASPGVAPAATAAATPGDRRALRALALLVWLDSTVGLPPPQRSDFLCGYRTVILLLPIPRGVCCVPLHSMYTHVPLFYSVL